MIRFNDILQKRLNGDYKSKEETIPDSDKLNKIKKEITSFNDASVNSSLEKILSFWNKGKPNTDLIQNQLNKVAQDVSSIESKYENYISSDGASDSWFESNVVKIIDSGDKLDQTIEKLFSNYFTLFNEQFDNIKTSKGLNFVSESRKKASSLAESTNNIKSLLESRNVPLKSFLSSFKTLNEYQSLESKIENIDNQIQILSSKLESIQDNYDTNILYEVLKEFDVKFLKGNILDSCEKINYLEGLKKLDYIKKESDDILKSPYKYISIKKNIKSDIDEMYEIDSLVSKNLPAIDISELILLETFSDNYSANKYEEYKDSLYLKNTISEYESTVKEVYPKAKDYLSSKKAPSHAINGFKPLPENEQTTSYNFRDAISDINNPSNPRLAELGNILVGSCGPNNGLLNTLDYLIKETDKISKEKISKSVYPMELYQNLKKYYDVGYLGELASFSDDNKRKIDNNLSKFYSFAKKFNP